MRNAEDLLVPLVANLASSPPDQVESILARVSPKGDWPKFHSTLPRFPDHFDFGSPNIRAMASVCALHHPSTVDLGVVSWLRAAKLEREIGFELEEPGSRIYRSWTLMARLLGFRWSQAHTHVELLAYFTRWLDLYWTLEFLAAVDLPDGIMSLRCGARSQGTFDRLKSDYALSIALDKPWKWRKKPHPLSDSAWKKSHEIIAFDALRSEIEKSSKKTSIVGVLSSDASIPTIAPTIYYRTAEGLAVWCERADINGNTPGISAMVWANGVLKTAPSPSRAHIRQKRVPQHIERLGSTLHFRQEAPGIEEELELELPSGAVIYEVRHGNKGIERLK